jgi:DNA polymerase III epsilon subunit-like protein
MSGITYYIIDSETTGLSSSYHEVNELSIIRFADRVQLTRFIKCEYPERANFDSLAITGKTLNDLSTGISKEQAVEECNKFFEEDGLTPAHRCLVAHNAAFDRRFIHALWAKCNQELPVNLWICSMALTRDYAKKTGLSVKGGAKISFKLPNSLDLVGIKKFSGAHASKVDTRNTYLLFKNLMEDKKVDHLPHIKTFVHSISAQPVNYDDECGLDPALLDID